MRRSDKSYLVFKIFYNYLIKSGIDRKQIITLSFDNRESVNSLNEYVKDILTKKLK